MVQFEEHLKKIRETERQIETTESTRRRNDLRKYLRRLWKEYNSAKMYAKKISCMQG